MNATLRPGDQDIVSPAAEDLSETTPNHTPKTYLTLSARPEVQHDDSGAFAVDRLDRILRSERDPITPELLLEKLSQPTTGLRRRLLHARAERRHAETEAELRAMWGDR